MTTRVALVCLGGLRGWGSPDLPHELEVSFYTRGSRFPSLPSSAKPVRHHCPYRGNMARASEARSKRTGRALLLGLASEGKRRGGAAMAGAYVAVG